MKLLKIESNGKNTYGKFVNPKVKKNNPPKDDDYSDIETITKQDVMDMLDYLMDNDSEFDQYSEGSLPNPVQAKIYKSICENFMDAYKERDRIKKEIDDKFAEAEKKYL